MLSFLPGPVQGVISIIVVAVNTVLFTTPLLLLALLKLIIPIGSWRHFCSGVLNSIAGCWISVNNLGVRLTKRIKWDVQGLENLSRDQWYLVLSNHQSWLDIVVLQKVLHRKIPMLKFFLKKELIWVPFLGLAWWALDFPFMKRYSRTFIEKYPHLKGKDLETTRQACAKFSSIPVSIMNFVEGTRFTCEKHLKQKSPYMNLLKPKAAGIAYVLGAMGKQLDQVLNVTIVYPQEKGSLWEFLCGKVKNICVRIETLPVREEILGDYFNDTEFREKFQTWLNSLWSEKDQLFLTMKPAGQCPHGAS